MDAALPEGSFGIEKILENVSMAEAEERMTAALKAEGFGVLTRIDVQHVMKEKLDKDLTGYVIIGACNPPLAMQALERAPESGLLLPCNVVVRQLSDGKIAISNFDTSVFTKVLTNRSEMKDLADEVAVRLQRAMDKA